MGVYSEKFLTRNISAAGLNASANDEKDLGHGVKDFLEGTYFVGVHGSLEIVVIIRVLLSLGNVSIAWFLATLFIRVEKQS